MHFTKEDCLPSTLDLRSSPMVWSWCSACLQPLSSTVHQQAGIICISAGHFTANQYVRPHTRGIAQFLAPAGLTRWLSPPFAKRRRLSWYEDGELDSSEDGFCMSSTMYPGKSTELKRWMVSTSPHVHLPTAAGPRLVAQAIKACSARVGSS